MPVKVVDASALAAVVFGEPDANRVAARLGEDGLAAPALLPFELASVCLGKLRRHPDRREAILAAYSEARQLDITETDVDFDEVLALAQEETLTVYDASYLWLALSLGVDLVTLDTPLAKAYHRRRES